MSEKRQLQEYAQEEQVYQQEEQAFRGPPPPPQQEPPRTMVIECNKALSEADGYSNQPHAWTNKFPAIKLKKGDVVSVNSAFLSSRGAGDLLQFDDTNSKTRLVFEYYNTNDNTNGKRPGYNMYCDGADPYVVSRDDKGQVAGRQNCFPADYRPMRLYRLMETYDLSQASDSTTGVPTGTGTPIPDRITETTAAPYPTVDGIETNIGYQRAGQQIISSLEDDYVPGLIRHATLSVREHMFSTGRKLNNTVPGSTDPPPPTGTPNYWGDNIGAHIWYISTPKSKVSPCNPDASMRIHFQHGADKPAEQTASLTLLRKLRPGMIIKWIDPEYIFGQRASSYIGRGGVVDVPGSNCWICDGYASDSQGFINGSGERVDSFRQFGDLRGSPFSNIAIGLGADLMKITKIYIDSSSTNLGGGTTPINSPFIEVICDRAYSCAFGDPNRNGIDAKPDNGHSTLDVRYFHNFQSSQNTSLFRTWMGSTTKLCALTEGATANPWLPHDASAIETNVPISAVTFVAGDKFCTLNNFRPTQEQIDYILRKTIIPAVGALEMMDRGNFIISVEFTGTNDTKINLSKGFVRDSGATPYLSETISILTNDFHATRAWNPGLFPEKPSGKAEDVYLAYKAYWYNTTSTDEFNISGAYAPHTCETSTQRLTAPTPDPLQDQLNFLARMNQFNSGANPAFTPPNYNLLALDKDGITSNTELTTTNFNTNKFLGEDYINQKILQGSNINPSTTYAGGRLPNCVDPGNPGDPTNYSDGSSYVKASRDETLSHGPYVNYFRSFENFYQYTTTDYEYISYLGGVNGVVDTEASTDNRGIDRLPCTQQITNQGGTLTVTADNGVDILLYFCKDIRADENEFQGGNIPTLPYAEKGGLISWGNIHQTGANQDFPDGLNFVGAHAHAPVARYNADGVDPDTGLDRQRGLYYGEFINSASDNSLNKVAQMNYDPTLKQDIGQDDVRYLMSQLEQSFYAEFHNPAGETEIMLIWCCGSGFINYNVYDSGGNPTNVQRVFATEVQHPGTAPPQTPEEKLMRGIQPGMVILKRDVMGTGRKTFLGNGQAYGGVTNCTINRGVALPNPGSYFTIIDVLANTESKITFNSNELTYVSLTNQDHTATHAFQNIFSAPIDTIRSANDKYIGGGDFVICKDPKQPYIDEGTSIPNYDNLQLTLFKENCLIGNGAVAPDSTTKTPGHTGKLSWQIHYDFVDLDVGADDGDVYFSASDVGSKLTQQMRAPKDLYNIQGGGNRLPTGTWPDTKGKYPVNSMFRPICGPCDTGMIEGPGALMGQYPEHSFCFFKDMDLRFINNSAFVGSLSMDFPALLNPFYSEQNTQNPESFPGIVGDANGGIYPVFPRTVFTNRNLCPTTNSMCITGHGNAQTETAGATGYLYTKNITRGDLTNKSVRPFQIEGTAQNQFVGTSNPQLIFNADHSRFEWQYLHQPLYSTYNGGTGQGADEVVKIWCQGCDRLDPWTRHGGINVVNWCADTSVSFGQFRSIKDSDYIDPRDKTTPNYNSQLFMNKLGFTADWIQANSGSTFYQEDITAGDLIPGYKPLGTTDASYDIVQSVNYLSDEPQKAYLDMANRNRNSGTGQYPTVFDTSTDAGTKAIDDADKADFEYLTDMYLGAGTWAYTNVNGGMTTQWGPDGAVDPAASATVEPLLSNMEAFNNSRTMGEMIAYGAPNTVNTPKSVVVKKVKTGGTRSTRTVNGGQITPGTNARKIYTDFNLDDVKFPYYQYAVISGGMRADSIPSKTKVGYYLIMSDLIDKHEFIGSANGGNPLNCIGVLSKNYENNDFYYSFQSPVEFYIKADKTISSIETRILQPDLKIPVGLDTNSSIIYTIVRSNPTPDPDVAPVAIQQAMDYALQQQLEIEMGLSGAFGGYMGISNLMGSSSGAGAGLNQLRQNLVESVATGGPDMMSNLYGVESQIQMNLSRASVGQRQAMILQAQGALDPANPAVIGQAPEQIALANTSKAEEALRAPIPPHMEQLIDPSKPYFDADFGIGDNDVAPAYRERSGSGASDEGGGPATPMSRDRSGDFHSRLIESQKKHVARVRSASSTEPPSEAEQRPNITMTMTGLEAGDDEDDMRGTPARPPGYSIREDDEGSPTVGVRAEGKRKQFSISQRPADYLELWSGNFDRSTQGGRTASQMMHSAIASQTDWDNPRQVPVDILRQVVKQHAEEPGGIIDTRGNRHKLDAESLEAYRGELEERGRRGDQRAKERAGGGGKQPTIASLAGPPPTSSGKDGKLHLYDVIHSKEHWLHQGAYLGLKDNNNGFAGKENPYDVRTWNIQKVRNFAESGVKMPMKSKKLHQEYDKDLKEGKDMSRWRPHTLKAGDGGLMQAELDRRAKSGTLRMSDKHRVTPKGHGYKNIYNGEEGKNKPGGPTHTSKGVSLHYNDKAMEPQNYQPSKPHQHPRGISRGGVPQGGGKVSANPKP